MKKMRSRSERKGGKRWMRGEGVLRVRKGKEMGRKGYHGENGQRNREG